MSEKQLPTGGCPGSASRQFQSQMSTCESSAGGSVIEQNQKSGSAGNSPSALAQWPVQLHLVPPTAPYFQNADLVVTADCVPFAYADYHRDFLKGRAVVVGCPKLDNLQAYVEKLTEIFSANQLKSVEVLLMEVPCCSGLAQATKIARERAGADFQLKVTTIGVRGENFGCTEA